MSICIAGMHRSGTSMIAGVLKSAGVYLGEESDFLEAKEGENAEGFCEHFGFYALNEKMLEYLRAGWDAPWLPEGWENREDLGPFREEARLLIDRMNRLAGGQNLWGWKDPRNSITIQFWKSLLPETKVVICVRNPVEVAVSLRKRNNLSFAASSRLWLKYYDSLISHVPPDKRVITHYENFFENFDDELERICAAVGLPLDAGTMDKARAFAKPGLRHNRATHNELFEGDLPNELIQMYNTLLEEKQTGVPAPAQCIPYGTHKLPQPANADAPDLARSRFNAETAQREEHIRHLVHENRLLTNSLAQLEVKLTELTGEITAARKENLGNIHFLSLKLQKVRDANTVFADRQAHWRALQVEMEKSLKDKPSSLPEWLRHSKTINSLYRHLRRIRKIGKVLAARNDVDDAIAQSLRQLTDLSTLMARSRAEIDSIPRGLEKNDTEKTMVDFSELAALLRIRMP